MLGNVLRSAEGRAGSRYGLDAIVVWPRFYPLLSDKVTAVLDDLRDQLDLAARFCVVFGVATMISIVFLAADGWWLTAAAVTLAGSLLSYRAALAAAGRLAGWLPHGPSPPFGGKRILRTGGGTSSGSRETRSRTTRQSSVSGW